MKKARAKKLTNGRKAGIVYVMLKNTGNECGKKDGITFKKLAEVYGVSDSAVRAQVNTSLKKFVPSNEIVHQVIREYYDMILPKIQKSVYQEYNDMIFPSVQNLHRL